MIAGNGVLVHGLGGTYPDQLDAAGPFERRLDASSAYFGDPSPPRRGAEENMTGFRVAGRA